MKLIDLLDVIPDECEISLSRPDDMEIGDEGSKYEAIARFAYQNRLIKEQVENMDVVSIKPCSHAQCDGAYLFDDDYISFNVSRVLVIEIE